MRWKLLGILAFVICTPVATRAEHKESAALATALDSITLPEIKSHVETLADDALEGREAGSRGGRAAGAYLVSQFEKFGLQPAGDNKTYFQSFEGNSRNILGLMPGADAALKDQIIVVGAHYDHVGYGSPTNSYGPIGKIHNGADDNASGVSGLLEMADALRQMPNPPRRTILFALWDGEEKGLNGSKHWMKNPTVPVKSIVFSINTDMIGRLREQGLEVLGTRTMTGLRTKICELNRDYKQVLDFTWTMKEDSDHWPFFNANIPVVMFHTGLHKEYHTPRDDAPLINYEGIRSVTRMMTQFLYAMATDDELPAFRMQARKESDGNKNALENPNGAPPPRFGMSWKKDETTGAMVVTQITPETPAHRAGVRQGDRIVRFNGQPVTDDRTLKLEILYAPKKVEVVVERDGQEAPVPIIVEPRGGPVRVGFSWREDDGEPGVLVVTHVVPHSAAAMAGFKLADRVDRVNGQRFTDAKDFMRIVNGVGDKVVLRAERKGVLQDVTVEMLPAREFSE